MVQLVPKKIELRKNDYNSNFLWDRLYENKELIKKNVANNPHTQGTSTPRAELVFDAAYSNG